MRIHKEGKTTLIASFIFMALVSGLVYLYVPGLFLIVLLVFIALYIFLLSFFRVPHRTLIASQENDLTAPADGKVVVIEKTYEAEYFKEEKLMVSIFMSPLNVHVNRNPVTGVIDYFKYHPGKYLAAWNPKASTENERTTTVYNCKGKKILMRQVAGALARRIVWYIDKDHEVTKGEEMGFIKFGSRVDLYLPVDSKVHVKLDQMVKGNLDLIATL